MNTLDREGLEKEITDTLAHSYFPGEVRHAREVRRWTLNIFPEAGYDLEIAALSHDIDRGVNTTPPNKTISDYDAHKKAHAQRSADIITGILSRRGFDESFVASVETLVTLHEIGGTPHADVLRDADSCSFFHDNLEWYFKHHGEKATRKKIHYMYDRMGTRAKELLHGKTYNDQALNKVFKEETTEHQQEP